MAQALPELTEEELKICEEEVRNITNNADEHGPEDVAAEFMDLLDRPAPKNGNVLHTDEVRKSIGTAVAIALTNMQSADRRTEKGLELATANISLARQMSRQNFEKAEGTPTPFARARAAAKNKGVTRKINEELQKRRMPKVVEETTTPTGISEERLKEAAIVASQPASEEEGKSQNLSTKSGATGGKNSETEEKEGEGQEERKLIKKTGKILKDAAKGLVKHAAKPAAYHGRYLTGMLIQMLCPWYLKVGILLSTVFGLPAMWIFEKPIKSGSKALVRIAETTDRRIQDGVEKMERYGLIDKEAEKKREEEEEQRRENKQARWWFLYTEMENVMMREIYEEELRSDEMWNKKPEVMAKAFALEWERVSRGPRGDNTTRAKIFQPGEFERKANKHTTSQEEKEDMIQYTEECMKNNTECPIAVHEKTGEKVETWAEWFQSWKTDIGRNALRYGTDGKTVTPPKEFIEGKEPLKKRPKKSTDGQVVKGEQGEETQMRGVKHEIRIIWTQVWSAMTGKEESSTRAIDERGQEKESRGKENDDDEEEEEDDKRKSTGGKKQEIPKLTDSVKKTWRRAANRKERRKIGAEYIQEGWKEYEHDPLLEYQTPRISNKEQKTKNQQIPASDSWAEAFESVTCWSKWEEIREIILDPKNWAKLVISVVAIAICIALVIDGAVISVSWTWHRDRGNEEGGETDSDEENGDDGPNDGDGGDAGEKGGQNSKRSEETMTESKRDETKQETMKVEIQKKGKKAEQEGQKDEESKGDAGEVESVTDGMSEEESRPESTKAESEVCSEKKTIKKQKK